MKMLFISNRKLSFKLLLSLACLLLGTACFSQPQWVTYNSTNSSLPNAILSKIAKDANGNLWVATGGAGLVKFDGLNFTTYDWNNSPLPHNICTAIATEGNIIWIGTVAGLVKLDSISWTTYGFGSGLPCNLIRDIIVDSNGNKWIGSLCGPPDNLGGGLTKFDDVNWTTYNDINSTIINNYVVSISEDNQGNIWTAHSEYFGGISRFDGINWTVYDTSNSALPTNSLVSITVNPFNNEVWVGSSQGAFRFDGTTWTIYNTNNSGMVTNQVTARINFDNLGNTWIGTQLGMTTLSNSGSWNTYNNLNSGIPTPNVIYDVLTDSVTWIATAGSLVKLTGIISIPNLLNIVEQKINIYPNPTYNRVNIDWKELNIDRIEMYDSNFRKASLVQDFNRDGTTIDLRGFAAGIYIVKLSTPDGNYVIKKLIVQSP